jgi:predicted N-acetyltransferase YhbS
LNLGKKIPHTDLQIFRKRGENLLPKAEEQQSVSMPDIRLLQTDELKEAVQLSDRIFRKSGRRSMVESFPQVFSSSLRQSFGAFAEGKLVSFVGLVPSVVRIGSARLSVYSAGSVCTHPEYRGKGYAGAVLHCLLSHVDKAGASLLLVSGYGPLYRRMDCVRFGAVSRFTIDPDSAAVIARKPEMANVRFRELEPADWFSLARLAGLREVCYEQSLWDIANLIQARAMADCLKLHHKVWVAEREGRADAFVTVGVPDQPNPEQPALAIEWAGHPRLIAGTLAHVFRSEQIGRLDVPVPWYETELLEALSPAQHQSEQNLGTVRIINPERLISQLRPYLCEKDRRSGESLRVWQQPDGRIRISCNGQDDVLDIRSFASLLFDPEPHDTGKPGFRSAVQKLFPVPFPYAGGLNYV